MDSSTDRVRPTLSQKSPRGSISLLESWNHTNTIFRLTFEKKKERLKQDIKTKVELSSGKANLFRLSRTPMCTAMPSMVGMRAELPLEPRFLLKLTPHYRNYKIRQNNVITTTITEQNSWHVTKNQLFLSILIEKYFFTYAST